MNLKQLSDILNLSQTTVSRALNGYPEVREATRRRVMEAARRYNYTPNTRAKGLATGRAMSIGHVIPLSRKHEILNPVFGDFITGASEAYVATGYDLVLSLVPDDVQAEHYRNLGAKGNVDGIILHGPLVSDSRIALLREIGLPFLVHGRSSGIEETYPYLDMNNRRAFARATRHLIELGHRRIALLNGDESMDFAARRRAGYEDALREAGIRIDPSLIVSGEMTESLGLQVAGEMLDRPEAPTAFLTSSIVIALGVERAGFRRGLAIGRDLSIITHDDALSYLPNGSDEPLFTATRSSVREAGRRCAELLLASIANPHAPPPQELLEADLIIGRSTGPAPRKDI
ncbi:LacI family DNA-binding transcriptional regulator [Roseivivax sp. THAF30]|uniref:LacI family DNA-binding transcriptional regulator n=1 Tax=Roseivivax sp. THAF30 TaxID=2587852 RepID=UPI00126790BD|nr:LacI family DNA-binding transcriptional regulator [Roseivivax sp. THAF30]QFT63173.1 HTH-type transcriptional repressor CytR [Roseivivax sp. THAF30]